MLITALLIVLIILFAHQICGDRELDGHLKGLLVYIVVVYDQLFKVVGDSQNVQILHVV